MSERSDTPFGVARELRDCAARWEPEARLLGNVRAEDIIRVCDTLLETEAAARFLVWYRDHNGSADDCLEAWDALSSALAQQK